MLTISSTLPPEASVYRSLASRYDSGTLSHAVLLIGEDGLGGPETALALAEAKTGLTVRNDIATWEPTWNKKDESTWMWARAGRIYYVRPAPTGILIDQIARLQEALTAQAEGERWVIIRGADVLRKEAANRLLKTLEEPAPRLFFLLTAGAKEGVLPTILSRVTQYALQPRTRDEFAALAKDGFFTAVSANEDALYDISGGNPGLALSLAGKGTELMQDAREFWLRLTDSPTCYAEGVQAAAKWEREYAVLLLRWLTVIVRDILWFRVGSDGRHIRCRFLAQDLPRLATLWSEDALLAAEEILLEALHAHRLHLSVKLITDMVLLRLTALPKGEVNANGGRRPL